MLTEVGATLRGRHVNAEAATGSDASTDDRVAARNAGAAAPPAREAGGRCCSRSPTRSIEIPSATSRSSASASPSRTTRRVEPTFERLAADPEFRVSFQLERGEAALFNNCAVLHNRTAFEDHDEPHLKRHLMRLWLMDWDGRGRRSRGCGTTRVKGGITPQTDKVPYYANRNPAIDSAQRRGSPL